MCREDVRFQRKTYWRRSRVSVGLASTELVPANPSRIALLISAPPTVAVSFDFDTPAVSLEGLTLYPADPPLRLVIQDFGQLVTAAVFAITTVAPQNVVVFECIWDDDGKP